MNTDNIVAEAINNQNKAISEWYTFDGITFRFRRIPAFIYHTARETVHEQLAMSKPVVPAITKNSKSMPNPRDAVYLEDMARWTQNYERRMRNIGTTIPILAGIELKDPIPPEAEWLDDVKQLLKFAGVSWESMLSMYVDSADSPDTLIELIYKKYVVLASDAALVAYSKFHQRRALLEANEANTESASVLF